MLRAITKVYYYIVGHSQLYPTNAYYIIILTPINKQSNNLVSKVNTNLNTLYQTLSYNKDQPNAFCRPIVIYYLALVIEIAFTYKLAKDDYTQTQREEQPLAFIPIEGITLYSLLKLLAISIRIEDTTKDKYITKIYTYSINK